MNLLSSLDKREKLTLELIRKIFVESHRELRMGRACPAIYVEFYPFVGINHTIRFKHGKLYVRLSDLFKESPPHVIRALAIILLSKLYCRKIPPAIRSTYSVFINSLEMKEKSLLTRSQRGHKLLLDPKGQHYDLTPLFDKLNTEYFGSKLTNISLGWSFRKSRRILGHFDPSHSSITISRIFDDLKVPETIVSYILFHEMLHAQFSTSSNFDLRNQHSHQFKNEERRFKWYKESNDWLRSHL
jgi:hypothetical protein